MENNFNGPWFAVTSTADSTDWSEGSFDAGEALDKALDDKSGNAYVHAIDMNAKPPKCERTWQAAEFAIYLENLLGR